MMDVVRVGSLLFLFQGDRFVALGVFTDDRVSLVCDEPKRRLFLSDDPANVRSRKHRALKRARELVTSSRARRAPGSRRRSPVSSLP